MSCEIDISSENIINVESESNIEIAGPSIEIDINKVPEYEIVVDKKEYIITGDNIYIPEYYDDAPQWLKDLVQVVTDVSIETNNGALIGNLNSIISEFANQYVPLNQFTQSILALNTEDERINAFITTLNSNFDSGLNEANAQIINLNLTKASKDEAEAIAIDTISAQLDTPSSKLGSTIGSIQQAIVNTNSASATSYDAIMSTLESADDAIIAQASANELLRTYVGMTEAGAYANQGLSAYLVDSTTGIIGGANSDVANSAWVSGGVAQTKWAYDSTIRVGGTTYAAGFGLSNSTGTGIGSEFWIDASRLKFTNSNKTGSKAPFTIDASGAVPQIKFNGVVDFTNVNGVPQSNQVFVQTFPPGSGMIKGDMWINTSTVSNEVSTYNGSVWLKSAGGNKTFSQAAAPTEGLLVGDLWIDIDDNNKYYRWNGSSWIEYIQNPALLINSGTTTINGGKITTGSITAAQINVANLFAQNIAFTGTITGGSSGNGGIIKSYDGKMVINLVQGSIYIQ